MSDLVVVSPLLIYVSGPMTGYPEANYPAFHRAERSLIAAGHRVLNPARHEVDPTKTWQDYMRLALHDVAECTAVALLDGWEHSRGARLEVRVARGLGLPVQYLRAWLSSPTSAPTSA